MKRPFGELARRVRQHWSSRRLGSGDRAGEQRQSGLKSFLRDQNGAIAAIAAVSLIVILGFSAFAIDMSYAYATRNRLQITASTAALAAAPELPDQSQALAKAMEYVEENMPTANNGMVLDSTDVVFGNWDTGTETWTRGATPFNAVEVTARRSTANNNRLELFLAPVLGLGFLDMEASAVAYARAPTAWDVALVQDVTGTFMAEIEDAKDADQAMLDCVSNNFINARMGLTTFSGTAPTPSNPNVPPHDFVPMLPVGMPDNMANYVAMSDVIFDIQIPLWQNRGSTTYGTHVGIGIESAIKQLDSYVPAPGIVGQAIVIVGDGRPEAWRSAQPFYPESAYYSNRCGGGDCTNQNLKDMAFDAADAAELKGYDVYVLYYEEDPSERGAQGAAEFFEALVRGSGQFRQTPNSDELDEMMFELCNSFIDLQLVM